jgi:amino acid transporter
MAIVTAFTILLLRGTKLGDNVQRLTSLAKTLALLVLVAACFMFGKQAHVDPRQRAPRRTRRRRRVSSHFFSLLSR